MTRVTCQISVSADGFVAGPDQTLDDPLGTGGERLHTWFFDPIDDRDRDIGATMLDGVGAFVMGRKMFGGGPGAWDPAWRGWWGENPPYHVPVFVLTHHPREPLEMDGGTTFHFVTDGIDSALAQARAVAGDTDVMVAGGASCVNQYLAAGLLDELYVHVVPTLLGSGERLFDGVGELALEPVEVTGSSAVTHVRYRVGSPSAQPGVSIQRTIRPSRSS